MGRALNIGLKDTEGGLLAIREGRVRVDSHEVGEGDTILFPPVTGERTVTVRALAAARIFRVVHGRGHGFIRRAAAGAGR